MGVYDRDYVRNAPPPPWFRPRDWSITTWFIVLNVSVFLLDHIISRFSGELSLTVLGYFSLDTAITHLQLWRFLTFQFLHADEWHLFWNMLGLYFFGPIVESHLGRRRYGTFFILCGFGGPLGYLFLHFVRLLNVDAADPLVGASAGIFGILVAGAWIAPNLQVLIAFTPFRLTLKAMALIYVGIAVFTVITYGGTGMNNAGGQAAHLGGALVGLILIRKESWLDLIYFRRPRMRIGGRRVTFQDWRRDRNH